MNKTSAILVAAIAVIAMIYCDTSHSRDYTQPYVIGPAPTGVDPGISMREFGALYILQQQQQLDLQRQQMQMMQQQQQQWQQQQRMQIMQDAFHDFRY